MKTKKPKRVLLVDDNQDFLKAEKRFLRVVPGLELVGEATCGEEAIGRKPSELLTFGRLAREQEGLRVFSFAADFERTEVLVPEPVWGIGIGFSPRFELVKVVRGDLAFAQPIKQMVAERGR